jgi:hypothetical protein
MIDPAQMMGGPQGPPSGGGGDTGQDGGSFDDLLSQARDLVSQAETKAEDDEDRETITKALAILNGHFATIQKDKNAALGITPVHKGVRRAMKSQGASGGGRPY